MTPSRPSRRLSVASGLLLACVSLVGGGALAQPWTSHADIEPPSTGGGTTTTVPSPEPAPAQEPADQPTVRITTEPGKVSKVENPPPTEPTPTQTPPEASSTPESQSSKKASAAAKPAPKAEPKPGPAGEKPNADTAKIDFPLPTPVKITPPKPPVSTAPKSTSSAAPRPSSSVSAAPKSTPTKPTVPRTSAEPAVRPTTASAPAVPTVPSTQPSVKPQPVKASVPAQVPAPQPTTTAEARPLPSTPPPTVSAPYVPPTPATGYPVDGSTSPDPVQPRALALDQLNTLTTRNVLPLPPLAPPVAATTATGQTCLAQNSAACWSLSPWWSSTTGIVTTAQPPKFAWAFVPPGAAQPYPGSAPAASQDVTGASEGTAAPQDFTRPTMCWVFGPAAGCARAEGGAP